MAIVHHRPIAVPCKTLQGRGGLDRLQERPKDGGKSSDDFLWKYKHLPTQRCFFFWLWYIFGALLGFLKPKKEACKPHKTVIIKWHGRKAHGKTHGKTHCPHLTHHFLKIFFASSPDSVHEALPDSGAFQ